MKIVTIVGTRPQFVKAAALSKAIQESIYPIREIMVHSGQHYDEKMSDIFFSELGIPTPDYNLHIGSASHAAQTGKVLIDLEAILIKEKPDYLIVYGDCNSTLSGALAAVKLHIPIIHIEAGLRSFNRRMPEEINRVLTDVISDVLFCSTSISADHLRKENTTGTIHIVGDIMLDCTLLFKNIAATKSHCLKTHALSPKTYAMATLHRAENTDNKENLSSIVTAFKAIAEKIRVIIPLHPRTTQALTSFNLELSHPNITVIDPLSYLDMTALEMNAAFIFTDSGGVQKEAFFHNVPCITMRNETEWTETVENGWNKVVGANTTRILEALDHYIAYPPTTPDSNPYGKGTAAKEIINTIYQHYSALS